jgi:hypothetical protein
MEEDLSVGFALLLKCVKQPQTDVKIYLGARTACGDAGYTFMMIKIGTRRKLVPGPSFL